MAQKNHGNISYLLVFCLFIYLFIFSPQYRPSQVCTSTFPWKQETGCGCRSTLRTASTVRPATSRTRAKTSTGLCPRAAADQRTTGCERLFAVFYLFCLEGITVKTYSALPASDRQTCLRIHLFLGY